MGTVDWCTDGRYDSIYEQSDFQTAMSVSEPSGSINNFSLWHFINCIILDLLELFCFAYKKTKASYDLSSVTINTRQVSSMIHSARPTESPLPAVTVGRPRGSISFQTIRQKDLNGWAWNSILATYTRIRRSGNLIFATKRIRNKTGVINDPLGQTHSPTISDHYFHLNVVLFFKNLKSPPVPGRTFIKIVITTCRDFGSASWINSKFLWRKSNKCMIFALNCILLDPKIANLYISFAYGCL